MSDHSVRLEETESESPEEKPQRNRCVQCLINNRFMITIIAGVLVGFAIGFGLRQLPTISETLKVWIFIAKLDPKENGKISTVAFIYIVLFNVLGASIGTAAAAAIGPGKQHNL
ncbi:unnamed protein product [Hydatigera taeniaeformis]|uniref:Amino acid transporter n=1 Tax=Hydatigena taeniaeformis TaxID=6205 RepID=A0A0R3XBE8_HYDTA|nr:unnamed protein product [Hydatigera taeniaeformis]